MLLRVVHHISCLGTHHTSVRNEAIGLSYSHTVVAKQLRPFINSLQQTAFGNNIVTKTTVYGTVILLNSSPHQIKHYFNLKKLYMHVYTSFILMALWTKNNCRCMAPGDAS